MILIALVFAKLFARDKSNKTHVGHVEITIRLILMLRCIIAHPLYQQAFLYKPASYESCTKDFP